MVLEACGICGLKRDRPAGAEQSAVFSGFSQQAHLEFLVMSRRRAPRRAQRKRSWGVEHTGLRMVWGAQVAVQQDDRGVPVRVVLRVPLD